MNKVVMPCPHCGTKMTGVYQEESQRYRFECSKCECLFATILVNWANKCYDKFHPELRNLEKVTVADKYRKERKKRKAKEETPADE